MKEKKSNTAKAVEKLFENLGENETLFVLHDSCEEENGEIGIGYTKKRKVTSTIAAIIAMSLQNRGENESFDDLTDIILEAVRLVRQTPVVGLELVHRELMDSIKDWKGADDADANEEEEEEHPCEGCEDILTCMDDDAIDYRKKHHLPKPKKGKKSK